MPTEKSLWHNLLASTILRRYRMAESRISYKTRHLSCRIGFNENRPLSECHPVLSNLIYAIFISPTRGRAGALTRRRVKNMQKSTLGVNIKQCHFVLYSAIKIQIEINARMNGHFGTSWLVKGSRVAVL